MNRDGFYMREYADVGSTGKGTTKAPSDNLTQWVMSQSTGFTRKSIAKVSRSVRAYVYLVHTYQSQAKSSTVGNSMSCNRCSLGL